MTNNRWLWDIKTEANKKKKKTRNRKPCVCVKRLDGVNWGDE